MKKNLTIIDLDSIIFIIAGSPVYKDLDRNPSRDYMVEKAVKEFISTIIEKTEADFVVGFYQNTGHSNYRKILVPDYKSNRKEVPEFIKIWKSVIVGAFKEEGMIGLNFIESDDAVNILHKTYKDEYEVTVAHIDVDLDCISGNHYNYNKNITYTVSEEDAILNYKCQCISGSAKDAVPGIYGIGKVKAAKFLAKNEGRLVKSFKEAFKHQIAYHKDDSWIKLFYRTYKCKKLLSSLDELSKITDQKETEIFTLKSCRSEKPSFLGNW